jgi:FecR protein
MSTRKLATSLMLAFLGCWLPVLSFADSQARIVRLSQVDGEVQVDRMTGQGYEKAFVNLPIIQGTKLRTEQNGRAEVEFEDGSTLRITPGTVVEFSALGRRDSGARVSAVNLQGGTAYLNFKGEKEQEFSLGFGQERVALNKSSHVRLELKDSDATLAVFKGDVEVDGTSGKFNVEKKHSVTFDLEAADRHTLANNLEPDPYDEWDKQQEKYHQQYSASASNSPYRYGMSDLNYYGSFYNVPGYGMMWQPYLVGTGWDPFMNGAWMWYPGFGYTWVSAYPWGWTPYRYGSWAFVPSYGWFWQPGRSWAGWNTAPQIVNPPQTFSFPRPPARPGQTLVVNRAAMPAGVVQNRAEIRADSAGLGVARGSIRNLGKISQQVERPVSGRGTIQTPLAASGRVSASQRPSLQRSAPPARSTAPAGGASPRMSAPAPSSSSSHGSPHK